MTPAQEREARKALRRLGLYTVAVSKRDRTQPTEFAAVVVRPGTPHHSDPLKVEAAVTAPDFPYRVTRQTHGHREHRLYLAYV